jgi:phosphocarrier protein HPr
MSTGPIRRTVVIRNKQGLHARPAELFVRLASQFQSRIGVFRGQERVDATSIINILTLGAAQGTELVLEAEGEDAAQAVEALARLVEDGFPMEDNEQAAQNTPQD